MTPFGIICPAITGHLNPMTTLGSELQRRGHRVTVVGFLDAQPNAIAAGLGFKAIAQSEYPEGKTAQVFTQLGKLSGLAAFQYSISLFQEITTLLLQNAPRAITLSGIEALLVDQATPAGWTVAEYLDIPFVTVCSALVLNRDDSVPPYFMPWSYNPAWWARWRNRAGNYLIDRIMQPIMQVIGDTRLQWNLPPNSRIKDRFSKLAILSQQPAEFEFPRSDLPQWFHFTGPYHDSTGRPPVNFPFEKLNGKPLIYASMGTLQNPLEHNFRCIAEACMGLDAQLVISLGGSASQEMSEFPGEPLIVEYAPQLELLQLASLTITHAGLNTTLESLSNGVPIVAIPIANDQPGVAARIAWTGTGEFIPLSRLSVPKLRAAIKRVLTEGSYKQNAVR